MRWLDGIIDSMDMSLSKCQEIWGTGKPGVFQSLGLQRVRHDLAAEQQQRTSFWCILAKQLIEKNATVNKINDSENENIQNVDDRKYSQHNKNNFQKKENQKDELEKDIENKEIEFTDPNLGKFIDISG